MFKTIVAATDGSTNAEKAVTAAARIAAEQGAKLHIVTAIRPLTPGQLYELKKALPSEFWPQLHADYFGEERITKAISICKLADVDPVTHMMGADPADGILDVADATGADLIVVGSRGEGPAKRLLHGSVSTKVIHHAHCSVLVVKEDAD